MKIGDRVYISGYIDEIRKDIVIIRNNTGYFGTGKEDVFTAETAKEREKKERKQEWIPCSERLPKERERVLICLDAPINQICVSQRVDTNYWIGQGRVNVLAWRKLPEPYHSMGENYGFPSKEEAELWMNSKPVGKEEI